METSLHRQLKSLYAGAGALMEQRRQSYRIDAVVNGRLIEIQQSSLAALRAKSLVLLQDHELQIVKPIPHRTKILRLAPQKGTRRGKSLRPSASEPLIASARLSPKRGSLLDAFQDLVHFTKVFPHPRLTVELVLADIEELRSAGMPRRRHRGAHRVHDRRLVQVVHTFPLKESSDLWRLLAVELPETFNSSDLARSLNIPRWQAQQIAYCLRECKAAEAVVRKKSGWIYRKAA